MARTRAIETSFYLTRTTSCELGAVVSEVARTLTDEATVGVARTTELLVI